MRVKLMSAIYDERQFAYLAGGSERVRATSAGAKAGTLAGELARSVFLFKSFPMTMLSTWGMRAAHEAEPAGRHAGDPRDGHDDGRRVGDAGARAAPGARIRAQ